MITIRLRTSSRDRFAQDLMNRGFIADMAVADGSYSNLTTTADEDVIREVAWIAGITCAVVHRA